MIGPFDRLFLCLKYEFNYYARVKKFTPPINRNHSIEFQR